MLYDPMGMSLRGYFGKAVIGKPLVRRTDLMRDEDGLVAQSLPLGRTKQMLSLEALGPQHLDV